jgi:FixJ family two-component response regulator
MRYRFAVANADPLIAVMDDEAPVRTMLGRVLRLAGFHVAAFSSGEEFLASLTVRLPACAIFDIHMPGLSGLDVHSRLRAGAIAIPIVFITASDDPALDRTTDEAGGVCLLRKPFSSRDLLAAVGVALEGRTPHA